MLWEFDDSLKQRKIELISESYDAYCLFTLQGLEITICEELNTNFDYCLATPLTKMSHRSRKGVKYDIQEVLLSGYIFLYVKKGYDVCHIRSVRNYFRILSRNNDDGRLYGDDLVYANWVLEAEGLISVSKAIELNGKVKIINGPLKNLEGMIVKYSKRNRNCLIEIDFMSQHINTWLPFDYVDIDTEVLRKIR